MVNTTKSKKNNTEEVNLSDLSTNITTILEKLDNLETKLNTVIEENKTLKTENSNLKMKVLEFERSINSLEQRSRYINVEINDVPVVKGEEVSEIIKKIGHSLGIEHPEKDFQLGHRVPTRNPNKIKPIIVRMTDTKARDKWIKLSKEKKITTRHINPESTAPARNIYLQCHLTPYYKNILFQTKKWAKNHHFKFIWVRDCQIYLKKDDQNTSKTFRIREIDDLKMVEGQPRP
ncbi:hypothetical protein M8J77_011260 [Diaphorina citri]|nr:hypothetical protein M8J77_011260 [Diaphorina citri]